ncbi:MAG: sulfite exporter TauE/SafE family protein, partial [Actinomycetota bacterium]
PGLVILGGMPQRKAHATSLAAIVPIAVAGALGYAIEGAVDWLAATLLTAGAAVGTVAGTRALRRLPDRTLRIMFAGFLLLAAGLLPVEVISVEGTAIDMGVGALLVAVGVLAGALAGLLGVGGGIVMVPALVLLASVPQAVAKGTSLAVIVPTALVGTTQNVRRGDVDLPVAAVAGGAGVVFAFLASLVSVRLDPVLSAVLFGLLLVAVAIRLLLSARGRPVPGDRRPVGS